MKAKKYIHGVADFLYQNNRVMSGEELAEHLNRNGFFASHISEFSDEECVYKLISETWHWLNDELESPEEAKKVATVFVNSDGNFTYKKN